MLVSFVYKFLIFLSKIFLRNSFKHWSLQVGYTDILTVHIFSLANCSATLLISAVISYTAESFSQTRTLKSGVWQIK